MPTPDRLFDACLAVLTAVQAGYAAQAVELPERQLVTPGLPAWDCAELAVAAERTFSYEGNLNLESPNSASSSVGHRMRGAVLALWMVRCVPPMDDAGNPPKADDEQAAAQLIYADADRMMDALHRAEKAGELGGCSGLSFDSWLSVPPTGGLGGGVLRVRVGLA